MGFKTSGVVDAFSSADNLKDTYNLQHILQLQSPTVAANNAVIKCNETPLSCQLVLSEPY